MFQILFSQRDGSSHDTLEKLSIEDSKNWNYRLLQEQFLTESMQFYYTIVHLELSKLK